MPKRLCPFECDLMPQFKMHIGEKEVYYEESMKSVYDKTLKMLFIGAKKNEDVRELQADVKKNAECPLSKQNYKQMFLDNQCKLQSGGTIKLQPRLQCQYCMRPEIQIQCTFCEKSLCGFCSIKCAKCSEEFCKTCSLVIYSGHEDEYMCLGCCR